MKLKKIIPILLIGLSYFSINNCAKIGSPPGGDKDTIPPVPLKSDPANYSTNYNQKKIKITFDEFIKLNNPFKEFTVSPPLEEKPVPLVRGKAVIIEFPSQEIDSLTYTLDFGQSIEDNNESNKLPNFQFVISKLPYIDSFSISGSVLDAYTKLIDKDQYYVLLNNNLSDTAFKKVIPSYLGRTNPEGEFNINHIAPGTYNVFALKDANNNMLYDIPSEVIAFSNEPLYLHPDSFEYVPPVQDTVLSETQLVNNDSILIDSLILSDIVADSLVDSTAVADSTEIMVYGYSFNLFSFVEATPFNLYLDEYERKEPEKLSIFFSEKLEEIPDVKLIVPDTIGTWYYLENSPTNDTLYYWLADSNLVSKDSIIVEITHPKTDTLGELEIITDTLLFRFKAKKKNKNKNKETTLGKGLLSKMGIGEDAKEADTLSKPLPKPLPRMTLDNNINKSAQDLNVPIKLIANAPILEYNEDLIELFIMQDTIESPVSFKLARDSRNQRTFLIHTEFESEANYHLKLYEGAFTDIYTRTIDSTLVNFKTQRDDYYGIIHLNISNVTTPVLLEFLDSKENVLQRRVVDSTQKITYDFLKPGKYMSKVIFDDNGNGKWDTGILDEQIQPERVEYYPTMLEVRSYLEVEYNWELPETNTKNRPINDKSD